MTAQKLAICASKRKARLAVILAWMKMVENTERSERRARFTSTTWMSHEILKMYGKSLRSRKEINWKELAIQHKSQSNFCNESSIPHAPRMVSSPIFLWEVERPAW